MSRNRKWLVTSFATAILLGGFVAAEAQQLNESFDGVTFPPTNWIRRNQSNAVGPNPTCWNRTTTAAQIHSGAGAAVANFNCTGTVGNISGWLVTPQLTALQNGNTVSLWTISAGTFADRLQVRLCLDTTPDSCGGATSTGTTDTDVGSFTTLLLDINPTLLGSGYPTVYTQFTTPALSGLPAGPNNGRVAFRYFVTNGGYSGANSNRIDLDDVVVSNTTPVELMSFDVE